MPHTKGTGNYPTNPNWLQVDQCGFGGQFMHISKSVIGKDSKKSIGLYRVHWNRSPFERDTGFCAIGVANATGSRYHFMCVEIS